MRKGRNALAFAVTLAVLLLLAWVCLRPAPPEPSYQGKPLSYWLQGFDLVKTNGPSVPETERAVREIGTNAVPMLVQLVRTGDYTLKIRLMTWAARHGLVKSNPQNMQVLHLRAWNGFRTLDYRTPTAVPGLAKTLDGYYSLDSKILTTTILGYMGSNAEAAVPSLLRTAEHGNEAVRYPAFWALGQIHVNPQVVIPFLMRELKDPFVPARQGAIRALGQYQADAKPAIPALLELINKTNVPVIVPIPGSPTALTIDLRWEAERALQQIDPDAYNRVVTNQVPAPTR